MSPHEQFLWYATWEECLFLSLRIKRLLIFLVCYSLRWRLQSETSVKFFFKEINRAHLGTHSNTIYLFKTFIFAGNRVSKHPYLLPQVPCFPTFFHVCATLMLFTSWSKSVDIEIDLALCKYLVIHFNFLWVGLSRAFCEVYSSSIYHSCMWRLCLRNNRDLLQRWVMMFEW